MPRTSNRKVARPQIQMILNSKSIGMDFKTELGQVPVEMELGQKIVLLGSSLNDVIHFSLILNIYSQDSPLSLRSLTVQGYVYQLQEEMLGNLRRLPCLFVLLLSTLMFTSIFKMTLRGSVGSDGFC